MDDINNVEQQKSAFVDDEGAYGKKIVSVPRSERIADIDVNNVFLDNISEAGINSKLDLSKIEGFANVSRGRDQVYTMLDTMSEDPIISAALETYAEDATEYNEQGSIVWVESSDEDIMKYVTYLLDTMNVDKNIYKWVYSLCKYGDLYLRLYRESDYKDPIFGKEEKKKDTLNEDVIVKAYGAKDKYVHYVEMIPNPAEMFELTRFGKTYGFIKTNMAQITSKTNTITSAGYFQYKFQRQDVEVYAATEFVHASLDDNSTRTPEEVQLFIDNDIGTNENATKYTYTVRRGQSILYNLFKIWRELSLLENSVLLNRVTKSSIVRIIGVEVADMPKERVQPHLENIKSLIEQKSAINVGESMSEYTNPGPVENNVYVPTKGGVGAITTQQIGGDVDVKSLADLDYFKNMLYAGLRIPKQYLGDTDDATGFNGGTALSLVSSRYGKAIKRIQNTVVQALTDIVNLMLIDKGLNTYINKFTLHMLTPTTQEEVDRRDNMSNQVGIVRDIMDILSDVEDTVLKLKILKSMLSNVLTDQEVLQIIQEQIDELEENEEETPTDDESSDMDVDVNFNGGGGESNFDFGDEDIEPSEGEEGAEEIPEAGEETGEETILPSGEDLGVDLTDNNAEF